MHGKVFQCSEEQTDRAQFRNTLDALHTYVDRHIPHPEDFIPLFRLTIQPPTLTMPPEPNANPTETELFLYQEKLKQYVRRETGLEGGMAAIRAVTWGQCSDAMKARLKALDGFQERTEANDCVWLLESIRSITLELCDQKKNDVLSLIEARTNLLTCKQAPGQSIYAYREILKGWADAIKFHGGSVAEKPAKIA